MGGQGLRVRSFAHGGAADLTSPAHAAGDLGERAGALRLALHAMGTRFELVLVAQGSSPAERALARAAGEAALEVVHAEDRRLSLFRSDSLLAHVNRRAAAGWVELDLDTFELLEEAQAVHAASGGAFDPTVAPLMEALGFHRAGSEVDPEALAAARAAVGFSAVELDPARGAVRFARPGVRLDLGAIAKGHALDLAAGVLREAGVERALLHGGKSSVVALGAPPGASAWRVALAPGRGAPAVALRDAALAVSAPHGRQVAGEGGTLAGHVLDARGGEPARGVSLAAVAGSSARRADAWSTALVAGATEPRGPGTAELAWRVVGDEERTWRGGGAAPGVRFQGAG